MRNTGVIAFCGSKGAGKTTSYEIFKSFYHGETEEIALAGHLKDTCSKIFDIDMRFFTDPALKEVELGTYVALRPDHLESIYREFGVDGYSFDENVRPHVGQVFETPRSLLQYVGTEVLHPIDPLIHTKIAMEKKDPNKLTVITDLRFVAEFNYFKDNMDGEFTPIYIKNSKAELAAETDLHPSERELTKFKDKCYLLPNETSKSELKRRLSLFVGELFGGTDGINTKTSQEGTRSTEESTQVSQN